MLLGVDRNGGAFLRVDGRIHRGSLAVASAFADYTLKVLLWGQSR